MKKKLFFLPLVMVSLACFAQNNIYPTAGNPLIYDYSPTIYLQRNIDEGGYTQGVQTRLLDGTNNWFFGNLHDEQWIVAKGNYSNPKVTVLSSGNMGIGTTAPTARLEVTTSANYDQLSLTKNTIEGDKGAGIVFKNTVNDGSTLEIAGVQAKLLHGGTGLVAGSLNFYTKYNSTKIEAVTVNPQGDMGIGTSIPREKLSVNGKIRAHEIKVDTNNWPDYVFDESYDVGTLEKLESYIKANKHLPEMPNAKEVETNGIALGEMNNLLLKKVEELTLHLIEKDKQLKNETAVIKNQQIQIEELKKGYQEIKEFLSKQQSKK